MHDTILSVPQLLALAHGQVCTGAQRCFYCGAACDESYPTRRHVTDTFTGQDSVACPGSAWICAGCVLGLREAADIPQIDGITRHLSKAAVRMHSWVLTRTRAVGALKSHLDQLRAVCLDPPEPPYALVLTESGQTHQLYRGVVGWSREYPVLTLEGERIDYTPVTLRERLALCGRIAAACGKPALAEPLAPWAWAALWEYHGTDAEALLDEWSAVCQEPLSRLAVFLCPNKESCQREYPAVAAAREAGGCGSLSPGPGGPD